MNASHTGNIEEKVMRRKEVLKFITHSIGECISWYVCCSESSFSEQHTYHGAELREIIIDDILKAN